MGTDLLIHFLRKNIYLVSINNLFTFCGNLIIRHLVFRDTVLALQDSYANLAICCKWLTCLSLALTCLSTLGATAPTANELEINSRSIAKPAAIAIPKTPGRQRKANFVDGKVLIKRIELKGDSLFPQYGVTQQYISQKLNAAFKEMDPWMSISDMHSLADALTIAYHEKGLTFNQVFIVPNEIEGNTLVMNILPGRVVEVNLKNNKLYTEDQIKAPFLHLLGKVVYEPDIQTAMKKANMIPGLKIFGFFSMGKHPGQARLNLHVLKEDRYAFSARVDNFGVNNTGVYRVIGQYSQNNVSGNGDTLSATLIGTNEIGNLYGAIGYKLPTSHPQNVIGLTAYSNQFEITGEFKELGLSGHLEALSGYFQKGLLKEDNATASLYADLALKNSAVTSDAFKDIFSETTTYGTFDIKFNAAVIPQDGASKQLLELGLTSGVVIDSDNEETDDAIVITHIRYEYQQRWYPGNPSEYVTSAILGAHYAPLILPSSERTVMTGPYGVRSYEPALFSADTVYSLTLEQSAKLLRLSDGFGILPFAFLDCAYGEQNSDPGDTGSFLGAGFGLDLLYKSSINARLTVGMPLSESLSQELSEDPSSVVVYGYINFTF